MVRKTIADELYAGLNRALWMLAAIVGWCSLAVAQRAGPTAVHIEGSFTDLSGAVIPGAEVRGAGVAAVAPGPSPNSIVRTWTQGTMSPPATIKDVEWLVGDWRGSLDESVQQSVVFSPTKGHMPGFARAWYQNGRIGFYEINDVIEINGSLEYRVKHFSGDFAAWEGKDEYQRHRLIAITDNAIYFDHITVTKEGPDHFTVYVLVGDDAKTGRVIVVHQSRAQK